MRLNNNLIINSLPKDKPYKIFDGAGLYLQIMPNGAKYWRFKYRLASKEKILALGVLPDTSLKDARIKLLGARKQLANGIDPQAVKVESKQQKSHSFQSVAYEWYYNNATKWDDKHRRLVLKRLEAQILPRFGNMLIQDVTVSHLLQTLKDVENRSSDTARRVLHTCGQIFKHALLTSKIESDISIALKGVLCAKKTIHYAYLAEKDLIPFLKKVENYHDKQTKLALKLMMLTFVRSSELRGAKWTEIDWVKREWRIPAERTKMKIMHIVPLSAQAILALLELFKTNLLSEYVLPSPKNPATHISENVLLHAIYDMGYKGKTTVHGFRSTASTILNENGFQADVIERQLAHTERNKVRASYNHAQYLSERKNMMQWWAGYLDQQNGNNIIQMKRV